MKLPRLNTMITFLDAAGSLVVPRLNAAGRFLVDVGSSVAPSVGAIPPTSPSNGDLWFNTSSGWNVLMVYESGRSAWLSVGEMPIAWGADSSDGASLRSNGVNTAGTGSGNKIPLDAMIVRVSARSRQSTQTKSFRVLNDAAGGSSSILSFSLSSGEHVDNNLSVSVSAGENLWIESDSAGASVRDVTVILWMRWRVAP